MILFDFIYYYYFGILFGVEPKKLTLLLTFHLRGISSVNLYASVK